MEEEKKGVERNMVIEIKNELEEGSVKELGSEEN